MGKKKKIEVHMLGVDGGDQKQTLEIEKGATGRGVLKKLKQPESMFLFRAKTKELISLDQDLFKLVDDGDVLEISLSSEVA